MDLSDIDSVVQKCVASLEKQRKPSGNSAVDKRTLIDDAFDHSCLDIPDSITCSVCRNFFFRPISTACGHRFCTSCILDWISRRMDPLCPLCRSPVGEPQIVQDLELEETVVNLCGVEIYRRRFFWLLEERTRALLREQDTVIRVAANANVNEIARVGSQASFVGFMLGGAQGGFAGLGVTFMYWILRALKDSLSENGRKFGLLRVDDILKYDFTEEVEDRVEDERMSETVELVYPENSHVQIKKYTRNSETSHCRGSKGGDTLLRTVGQSAVATIRVSIVNSTLSACSFSLGLLPLSDVEIKNALKDPSSLSGVSGWRRGVKSLGSSQSIRSGKVWEFAHPFDERGVLVVSAFSSLIRNPVSAHCLSVYKPCSLAFVLCSTHGGITEVKEAEGVERKKEGREKEGWGVGHSRVRIRRRRFGFQKAQSRGQEGSEETTALSSSQAETEDISTEPRGIQEDPVLKFVAFQDCFTVRGLKAPCDDREESEIVFENPKGSGVAALLSRKSSLCVFCEVLKEGESLSFRSVTSVSLTLSQRLSEGDEGEKWTEICDVDLDLSRERVSNKRFRIERSRLLCAPEEAEERGEEREEEEEDRNMIAILAALHQDEEGEDLGF